MCGIAGVVMREEPIENPSALADSLDAALAHRGPDARGRWWSADRTALLVHRRLAIIDPTPAGAQPMTAPTGELLVFNGEIYNYRQLRAELESRGERLTTSSDAEVLLRIVALDGSAALGRLRGMFAFACWDPRDHSVLLARDRCGIKPLYVAAGGRRIAFASEIGALRAARLVDGRPSPAGVLAFLEWGSIPPPLSAVDGVRALAPGTWIRWHQNGHEERGQFADVRRVYVSASRRPQTGVELAEQTRAAVEDSVRAHLVADVPVGVFLSGGIDSASIVSAAASLGASRLRTFTVVFDAPGSEAEDARRIAGAFGADHHEIHVDAAHVSTDWPAVLARLDQPSIDAVNAFYVSRAVSATGIKAVLSGLGGDELFGGYPSFRRLPPAFRMRRLFSERVPLAARAGATILPVRLARRWNEFVTSRATLANAYRVQRGFLMRSEAASLAGPALRDVAVWRSAQAALEEAEESVLSPAGDETLVAGVARLETRLFLGSQLLRDTDAMSMAHGLEVRVPFVDHELVSTVWPELGFHAEWLKGKRLLQGTLQRPLPAAIADKPKRGFTLPFAEWMAGELGPLVRDGLHRLSREGWIAPQAPETVWNAWRAGAAHWSRPWGLAVLGHYLAEL